MSEKNLNLSLEAKEANQKPIHRTGFWDKILKIDWIARPTENRGG